jgi:hypothetical protein
MRRWGIIETSPILEHHEAAGRGAQPDHQLWPYSRLQPWMTRARRHGKLVIFTDMTHLLERTLELNDQVQTKGARMPES